MKREICSMCGKRIATVFVTQIDQNGNQVNKGLCIVCAKKLNLPQVNQFLANMNISDEDLESMADEDGTVRSGEMDTSIFIYPGYRFKVMDALITNFHLPESTLVMLVSAFAGKDHIMAAYEEAVKERYRFFSFGDAMYIY